MRIKVLDSRPAVKDLLKKLVDASVIEKATSIEWYSNPDDFLEAYVSDANNLIFIKFGSIFSGLDIAKKLKRSTNPHDLYFIQKAIYMQ